MKTQKVTLKTEDAGSMNCYCSMPQGKGQFPGMIVLQEAFGVNSHIRNVADRLAKEGFATIAPQLFHRTAEPDAEFPYTDFNLIMPHFQGITPDGLTADLKASYQWLQAQGDIKIDKIGSIGFCLGGRVSFLANMVLPLAAAVSYYGGQAHSIASRASEIHGPHLFFWGGLDKHILPEHVETVINEMKKAGKTYINVIISYADHAFNCDDRPNYNKDASIEAWAMAMAFLKNKLG
jgi:carboxymethylenebutenolidase